MSQRQKPTLLSEHAVPPGEIEARSFAIIDRLIPVSDFAADELEIVKRIGHPTGDPEIVRHIRFHPRAIDAGAGALRCGATVFADVKMVAMGINRQLAAKLGSQVVCLIEPADLADEARARSITRAAAGVLRVRSELAGAIVAIGNAPTALLALLDLLDDGYPAPALIVGVPVGFVAAAEAKAELVRRDLPWVTLEGTRGGSTIAAAIVNALLKIADNPDLTIADNPDPKSRHKRLQDAPL